MRFYLVCTLGWNCKITRYAYIQHCGVLSHFISVWLFATLWTVVHQTPLSMGFSRQEYWRGLPFPSPGDLPNPGIKSRSPALQADYLLTELLGKLAVLTKESACNAGDTEDLGLIPGSGRTMYLLSCPGGEHGNLLQYSCLENTMDRGALWSYSPYSRKELDRTEAT